jgi:uncharacterized membrane protein
VFLTLAVLLLCVILVGIYAARQFKSMAYHAIDREKLLAIRLQVQPPHEMMWGYLGGLFLLAAGLVALVTVTVHRFRSVVFPWFQDIAG